jgi:small-conductance mechanosensitive channel
MTKINDLLCPEGVRGLALAVLAVAVAALFGLVSDGALAQGAGAIAAPPSAVQATAQPAPDAAAGPNMMSRTFEVRDAFERTLAAAKDFPDLARQTLIQRSPDGTLGWLWTTGLVLLVGIAAGIAALRLTERWGQHRFLHLYSPDPSDRATKIAFLFTRALVMGVAALAFMAVAAVVVLVGVSGHDPSRASAFIGLESVFVVLLLRLVFLNVFAPGASAYRLLRLDDGDAHGLYRSLIAVAGVAYAFFGLCRWMALMGLDLNAHKLALIGTTAFSCLALSAVVIVYRKPLTRLVSGPDADAAGREAWRRSLTLLWLPVTVVYFLGALLVTSVRVLLEKPAALGLVGAPIFCLLVFAVLYGLMVLVIDRWLLPRLDGEVAREKAAQDLLRAAASEGEPAEPAAVEAQAHAETLEAEAARKPYRALLDHGAAIIALVAAVAYLLTAWGVPLVGDASIATNLFEIGVIVFIGHMAYQATALMIDSQIKKEGSSPDKETDDNEIGGAGESRLATLLPIFRNFLLISIVVIAGMIALSQVGVNIAPLFAGAGVVGLAVGFGAQTLIRDIFSGAFFLVDDAFRKGEYIDIGDVKGTVEKISIRSMQLRHHNGPLNTVPFGEIKFVKNFSRDWAVMKLAFRVTYDTDVEKMRKLIKKFGQGLLEHPDYGPKFLQPVKSQGVTALEDSAMIVRVKFMTRPGDQFELRKVVYAGIRDLCEREGIHFAHREVTVRVSQDPNDPREFSEAEKKAIGGAVLPTLEDGQAPSAAAAADGR